MDGTQDYLVNIAFTVSASTTAGDVGSAQQYAVCLDFIYARSTGVPLVVEFMLAGKNTSSVCGTVASSPATIGGLAYNVQEAAGILCVNTATLGLAYTGTLSLRSLNDYLLSTNRLSAIDFFAKVEYNFIGNGASNHSLLFSQTKAGRNCYFNSTTITLGSVRLDTALFASNTTSTDYCNVSVAVGQPTTSGTIVDFLYSTGDQFNVQVW